MRCLAVPTQRARRAPAPCVVMASGFSCVRDQGLDAFAERFAAAGLAVLAFDYRGFGESGGRATASWSGQACNAMTGAPRCAYARSLEWVDRAPHRNLGLLRRRRPRPATGPDRGRDRGGDRRRSARRRRSHAALHRRPSPPHPPRPGRGSGTACALCAAPRPIRIPAAGLPGSAAVINSPEGLQRLRIDHAAGLELAQRSLRPYLPGAAIPAEQEGPSHPDPDPLLHHRGRRRHSPGAGEAGGRAGAVWRAAHLPGRPLRPLPRRDPGADGRRPTRVPRPSA